MSWQRVYSKSKHLKKSKADRIKPAPKLVFIPDEEENGIPYHDNVDWVKQWVPDIWTRIANTGRRIVLVVCVNEDYPEQIWTMKNNCHRGACYLEWKREEEE